MPDAMTAAYRAGQLRVRGAGVKQLAKIWPSVDPTNLSGTIDAFTAAAVALSARGSQDSAALSASYYEDFRRAQRITGRIPGVAVAPPAPDAVAADALRGAALGGIIDARRRGRTIDQAADAGLVKTAGALIKLILTGGRMTIIGAADRDPKALGWQRVTSGDPCAFCRMVAGRGPVYTSQRSADFTAHDTCGCTVRAVFDDRPDAQVQLWAKQYKDAQAWAKTNVDRKSPTSSDPLNNLRLYTAAGTPDVP